MSILAPADGGVRLRVRVQPRASRSEIAGVHGDELRIRLQAPPVDGAANEALVRFLADALGAPRAAVEIVSGLASRSKTVVIRGVAEADAARRLAIG
jgi:uncharacterized protein (TIGR00251 family)